MSESTGGKKRVVIIGGVAGGASCAARCRRLCETAEIILVERTAHVSFATCGIPYYVGDVITDEEKLLVATPKLFHNRFGIETLLRTEAVAIQPERRTVLLKNLITDEQYELAYDDLVLAAGAKPIKPPLPGIDDFENIYVVRTIPDGRHIKEWIEKHECTSAVVVGAGFIGLEMVENLMNRGIEVTLIEGGDQVLAPVDSEIAEFIQESLVAKGVHLRLGEMVAGFSSSKKNEVTVHTKNGVEATGGLVILGIGVIPNVELAKSANIELGQTGGIKVDASMKTSQEHIYAAGDSVESMHKVTKKPHLSMLAGPANRQGRIAANSIFGAEPSEFHGVLGTAICSVFGTTVAVTGASVKTLEREGIEHEYIFLHPKNHAGYFPFAEHVHIKLIYAKNGLILGAQAAGKGSGVDKRIDILSTAIQASMTVYDLEESELCYSPQFGSAKDPINLAGMIAANNLRGLQPISHWPETLDALRTGEIDLIDVRSPREYQQAHCPGAENIPLESLREAVSEGRFSKDRAIHVYCLTGMRAYVGERILKANGFDVKNVTGGWLSFPAHTLVDKASSP